MDELIKALTEALNTLNLYIKEMSADIEMLKQIKNNTLQQLGNDSLAKKTTAKLDAIRTKLEGNVNEVAGIAKKVSVKRDELIKVRNSF